MEIKKDAVWRPFGHSHKADGLRNDTYCGGV